ncbi:MAG: hypothetical protein Q7U68_06545 [Candidatus Roizmanbacteria bacterium]|nr:hypothetical protein [Candidatus Roizmanbacteria bacterium]
MERKNTELIKEFNRYVCEHPQFSENIPDNALVVMQLEGDEEFNEWSREMAQKQAEEGQPVVHIRIKKIRQYTLPIHEQKMGVKLGDTFWGMCTFINPLDWR